MLSRKTPLIRKTALKRNQTPIKRTPVKKKFYVIKKVSDKHAADLKLYYPMAAEFKKKNPYCLAKLSGCTYYTVFVHHRRGRGIWLLVVDTWLPVCHNCHDIIEMNPEVAKALNFSEDRLKNYDQ